jgi:hypothetical protein
MKKIYLFCLITLATISCKKEKLTSTQNLNEIIDSTAVLKYSGEFISGPYGSASGSAEIYFSNSSYILKVANFNVNSGPALHVYVSIEAMPINFIDLGELKSTNGNQLYSITGAPDFTIYKYISIHCVDYNHLFGYALLN